MKNLKIEMNGSYKLGVDEIVGLKAAMQSVLAPVTTFLEDKMYWTQTIDVRAAEYKSRDGFIPYSSNLGGLEIVEIVPKCEEYNFGFLEFGEHECTCKTKPDDCNCDLGDIDGNLDAKLRIFFKFESVNLDTGEMEFYLYMGGGNRDAPYFRVKNEATIFEADIKCNSVTGLKLAAAPQIKKLLKVMGVK